MKLLVKIDDQNYEVEVGDLNARPVLATIDGEVFEIWPEEGQPAPVSAAVVPAARPAAVQAAPAPAAAPAATANVDRNKSVIAPIPGTIVAVTVKVGDSVNPGQELCSLEAMKMKNLIRATRAATIARVLIKVGDRVTQGQALVEYAD
jgi:glutaconyl-CoA/methylmalonyl-CoA decarboxylase subunit gamma